MKIVVIAGSGLIGRNVVGRPLAYALDGHCSALMWPDTAEQRLAIADEIATLAEQVDDNERIAAGRLYRVIANMELGRIIQAEQELDVIAEQAHDAPAARAAVAGHRQPREPRVLPRCVRPRPNADRRGTDPGARAQRRNAVLSHRLQLFLLDRETGGNTDVEALIKDAVPFPDATGVSMRAGVHPRPARRRESSTSRGRRPGSTGLRGGSTRQRVPVVARLPRWRRRHVGRAPGRRGALRPPGSTPGRQRHQRRRSRNWLRVENSRSPGRGAVALGRRSSG